MEKNIIEKEIKNKKVKNRILIFLTVFVLFIVIVGGFCGFRYMFPSDKDLFFAAHADFLNENEEEINPYTKETKMHFELNDGFITQSAVDKVKSISVSTKKIWLSDEKSIYDFNMQFLNKEFLSFSNVKAKEKVFLTIPQLINETYSAEDANEILSVLFGSEKSANKDLLDGVDIETSKKYLKKYFLKLYKNIPKKSFSSSKVHDEKTITFNDSVNRMLYDIVKELELDTQFRDFLYEQTNIVYTNINTKFSYAGTLLEIPEKDEYDKNYKETLDKFIENIENIDINIVSSLNGRKFVKESIKILDNNELLYDISYDLNNVKFIEYKESVKNMSYIHTTETDGTKKYDKTVLTMDVNQWTKDKIKGQKNLSLVIDSITDTNVTEKIAIPENSKNLIELSDEEKKKIQETVSKNVTELLASFTLSFLLL